MSFIEPVKDFFIKKIILPKVFRIDIPGYIIGKFYTAEGQRAFVRNMFLPELFFVALEDIVYDKLKEEGLSKLYGIGKDFGYRFATLNRLPKTNIKLTADLIADFFNSLYAESVSVDIDLSKNTASLDTKDLVVTRVNGGGLPLTIGGSAGIWGYITDNFENIESGVLKKGENRYLIICSTEEILKKNRVKFYRHRNLKIDLDSVNYLRFNSPPKNTPSGAFNINRLMQTGLFTYEKGSLKFSISDFRFAPVEISLPYELELSISEDILLEAAQIASAKLSMETKKQANSYLFLANMFTAMGYGLVTVENANEEVTFNFNGFPWYGGYEKSKFPILRGIIKGFLSNQLDSSIKVSQVKTMVVGNSLLVSIAVVK